MTPEPQPHAAAHSTGIVEGRTDAEGRGSTSDEGRTEDARGRASVVQSGRLADSPQPLLRLSRRWKRKAEGRCRPDFYRVDDEKPGKILVPGKPDQSDVYTSITEREMPDQGRPKPKPQELMKLRNWILQGAKERRRINRGRRQLSRRVPVDAPSLID